MASTEKFGALFRARRKALGLSLRAFCARHGLDPGNISRLERGLLPPPQSSVVIRGYAESLKLEPDSPEWRHFEHLAAVETAPLLPKDTATQRELLRTLGRLGEGNRTPWVGAGLITQWADRLDARAQLPQLVRRLIFATVPSIERIEIAAGDGSQRRGWDGIVVAASASPFVPAGLSVWEFGVSADPRKKIRQDFANRTKRPLGVNPSDAVYISVTPRRWESKVDSEKTMGDRRAWRDVRVYDADTLEMWLEAAPAVDIWFARQLGIPTEGLVDVERYWSLLSGLTEPPLLPDVFLTSREQEQRTLWQWLQGPPSSLAVQARAPAEVIDFLAAYLASADDDKRSATSSRVVIVEAKQAWNILAREAHSLTLVAKAGIALEPESVAEAVSNGHHVLLCSDRFDIGQSQTLTLPPPNVYDLQEALERSGFEPPEANRKAFDSSGSLTVLKRRISRFPATTEPEWARSDVAAELAPLTLIGSWNETSPRDQAAVAEITGRKYSEVASLVTRAMNYSDPPLMRLAGNLTLTSREDSWILLARHLNAQQLEAWRSASGVVLIDDDPKLDLPAGEWMTYSITHGRSESRYSNALRHGIAESLAVVAARPEELGTHVHRAADISTAVVRQVLGDAPGWKRWASLQRQLPLLAEASPDEFLAAIETELRSNGRFMELFANASDPFNSSCQHAGLLWALETVAWSPEHLGRTSLVLARLAERDPGGTWGNRPAQSLRTIFLPWLPQTAADVEQRIMVLQTVSAKCPKSGWCLLLNLLPKSCDNSLPTPKPMWRDWKRRWKKGVTNAEFYRQTEACAVRLLELVGNDSGRWQSLIENISRLPHDAVQKVVSQLASFDLSKVDAEQRKRLAEVIRQQLNRHRRFAGASWTLPADTVSQLDAAIEHIEPDDPVVRHVWLFVHWPELGEPLSESHSTEDMYAAIAARRRQALFEVFESGGMPAVLRLAASAGSPFSVGLELANTDLVRDESTILPSLLANDAPSAVELAQGFAYTRYRSSEFTFIDDLPLASWSGLEVARLALALPAERRTWDLVERHSSVAMTNYWSEVPRLFRLTELADVEYAVSKLVTQQRPFTAIQTIEMALHNGMDVNSALIMGALEAGAQPSNEPRNDVYHAIGELFTRLHAIESPGDASRMARLEWMYLPLLDGRPVSPVILERELRSNPRFFAELLSLIYRARSDAERSVQPASEEDKLRAKNAYTLLHDWADIPGLDPTRQSIDEEVLRPWINEVRRLCRESDRIEICDSQLGQLLAHAPPAPDGSWPCLPVRDMIDEIDTEDLVDGFIVGTLNRRGIVRKSPMDGGEQERTLASRYVGYARACDSEWPRTAAALRSIAESYARQASREDTRAESRRAGRW